MSSSSWQGGGTSLLEHYAFQDPYSDSTQNFSAWVAPFLAVFGILFFARIIGEISFRMILGLRNAIMEMGEERGAGDLFTFAEHLPLTASS